MSELFEEIKVEKVSDKISEQIIALIVDGKLKPGDKLPGERQLIEMLGVGRSSLREALNRLETLGYIEVHKRRGNFVKSIDPTFKRDPLKRLFQGDRRKLVQLYDIRCDFESANAYNAALYRTESDLSKIADALATFKKPSEQAKFSWDADQQFHIAIAHATQNFLRVHVITNIFNLTEEFLKPVLYGTFRHDENHSAIIKHHEAIYQTIADQDADEARKQMDKHLRWAMEHMMEWFDDEETTQG